MFEVLSSIQCPWATLVGKAIETVPEAKRAAQRLLPPFPILGPYSYPKSPCYRCTVSRGYFAGKLLQVLNTDKLTIVDYSRIIRLINYNFVRKKRLRFFS